MKNIDSKVVSRFVGGMLQRFSVCDRTIGEEIASSRLDDQFDLEEVAKSARFADFANVVAEDPNGYESQIGPEFDGRLFSGGEEQKLVLARAKYRNSPIFILDEPDASLDAEGANIVFNNILALDGPTVIVVTQYPTRAERFDEIVVLEDGELKEAGSPAELLALDGVYARMVRADKARRAIED